MSSAFNKSKKRIKKKLKENLNFIKVKNYKSIIKL